MADDESVQATEDTGLSDVADTSTNEDTQDTDTDLEDMEISFDDVEETEESEESDEDEAATESTEDESEKSSEDVDEESKEEDTTSEEAIKQRNAEMAQKRIAEREAREQAKREEQMQYLDEAEDNRDLALRQLQVDAYNNKVESNSNKLQNGIDKAVAAIDLFRTGSQEVKEELANSLDDFERMYVVRDRNGDPINVQGDVYQYLQSKADSIRRLTGIGARQQEKSKSLEKSRTITTPVKTPKEPKVDPDMDAFDEEANRY